MSNLPNAMTFLVQLSNYFGSFQVKAWDTMRYQYLFAGQLVQ